MRRWAGRIARIGAVVAYEKVPRLRGLPYGSLDFGQDPHDVAERGVLLQDVWRFKDPQYPTYPTEKSLEMLEIVVTTSSNPGDLVLGPYCGSGTTLGGGQARVQAHWHRRFRTGNRVCV